ncbi:cobalamin biosynthesis protein CobD [Alphaproteobacteria bacterium HT1-32]|nr:cobalamin biosynthesis protein CobD [Alphaproteobacteria bacterium HT1-32]
MNILQLPDSTLHLAPLLLLLFALGLDAVFGEMGWVFRMMPHPVVLIGRLISSLERRLNRENRGQVDRAIRGFLVVVFMVGSTAIIGAAVSWVSAWHPFGWLIELFLVATLVAQRSLYDHVAAVAGPLSKDDLPGARKAISRVVGRDPNALDKHGVTRAGIETTAENFGDGVVAPVFWYLLFGFPGILVYKTVNTLDSMIGYRNDRYRSFGFTAAKLDDLLNWVPARLSGLILVLAAIVTPGAHAGPAFRVMLRDAGKHRSPNAGWPEGAMAGALDVALAGPRRYGSQVVDDDWIGGKGRARATVRDLRRALVLYTFACVIHAALIAGLWAFTELHRG